MIQQAIKTARTLLPSNRAVTVNEIENAVDNVLAIPIYHGTDRITLIRELQSMFNFRIDEFRIIEADERRQPWLNEKKADIWNPQTPSFWTRYRDYLQYEKNFPDIIINQTDRLTNRILDGLFDPSLKIILSKYGLVAGQVQSGKTSNYTGLICKAADAGFRLIIVLAGVHNNLRSRHSFAWMKVF